MANNPDVKYVPFFASFDLVARNLADSDRLALYDAICDFGFRGKFPDFANKDDFPKVENAEMLQNLFLLIMPNVETVLKKMVAGKKGGRPKKE